MGSPLPLLLLLSLIAVAAMSFAVLGLPMWIVILLAYLALVVFMRLMDVITSLPMLIRNRRVHETACPSCGQRLGGMSRWHIHHPDYNVECSSCCAVCTFDASGMLKRPKPPGADPT